MWESASDNRELAVDRWIRTRLNGIVEIAVLAPGFATSYASRSIVMFVTHGKVIHVAAFIEFERVPCVAESLIELFERAHGRYLAASVSADPTPMEKPIT